MRLPVRLNLCGQVGLGRQHQRPPGQVDNPVRAWTRDADQALQAAGADPLPLAPNLLAGPAPIPDPPELSALQWRLRRDRAAPRRAAGAATRRATTLRPSCSSTILHVLPRADDSSECTPARPTARSRPRDHSAHYPGPVKANTDSTDSARAIIWRW